MSATALYPTSAAPTRWLSGPEHSTDRRVEQKSKREALKKSGMTESRRESTGVAGVAGAGEPESRTPAALRCAPQRNSGRTGLETRSFGIILSQPTNCATAAPLLPLLHSIESYCFAHPSDSHCANARNATLWRFEPETSGSNIQNLPTTLREHASSTDRIYFESYCSGT